MRASVIPDVIDALVQLARTNLDSTVTVCDGYPTAMDPGDYLCVGVEDAMSQNPAVSGEATQTWPLATPTGRNEEGSVVVGILVYSGDQTMKTARDRWFTLAGIMQNSIRSNRTLGVPGVLWTNVTTISYQQDTTNDGITADGVFHVAFRARI